MARMYPEVFPGIFEPANPEFIVYQCLRKLPDSYVVLYSKRFKGGLFGKPECEIDFIISNQRDVVICLEVKGGLLAHDGVDPEVLRSEVTSPNGATAAGLRRMADRDFRGMIREAVIAARDRARELSA